MVLPPTVALFIDVLRTRSRKNLSEVGLAIDFGRCIQPSMFSSASISAPAGTRADINLHWHDLRHEHACRLAKRGVPITKIQYLGPRVGRHDRTHIHHTLAELRQQPQS